MKAVFGIILLCFFLVFALTSAFAFSSEEVLTLQQIAKDLPLGERIAFFASSFIGTPYDTDPLGEYVTKQAIVADERVDCMYLVYRSAELALAGSLEEAQRVALDMRFATKGRLGPDGKVENYNERFEYGEDMIRSGKWGRDITPLLGRTVSVPGSHGVPSVNMLPKESIAPALAKLKSGDIIFFIKDPAKRTVGEIVGHIGIIKREVDRLFLIHASGSKKSGGCVKKVPFTDYVNEMGFAGIMATRLDRETRPSPLSGDIRP
jgi:hypothetical protein